MSRVVVAGGTGFIGSMLVAALNTQDHDVVILTRRGHLNAKAKIVKWFGHLDGVDAWMSEVDGTDAVINLCGSSVATQWTDENKKKMTESRLKPTEAIAEGIWRASQRPKVWISASATGFYGNQRERILDESSSRGPGFLSTLCVQWEDAVKAKKLDGTRVVELRIGMVLGPGGGAFPQLLKATKSMFGGPIGDGKQWVSWIHWYDLIRLIQWLMESDVSGPVNAVAPEPVRNADLMKAFRRQTQQPMAFRVPRFVMNWNAKMGGPEPSLLLESTRAVPKLALERGFEFTFPDIDSALKNLVSE